MKYKKLIVSGCSFTENEGSWAYVLASILDIELINLAVPGAGNKHVQYSLMNYIAKNNPDPETTLIGIMWSHPVREDMFIERNPEYEDQNVYRYKFDEFTSEISLRYIIDHINENNRYTRINVIKNKIMATNDNRAGITLDTWTSIESTISFLKCRGYDFFQTIFHDFLEKSDLLRDTDEVKEFQRQYLYTKELERIDLKQNKDSWLELQHSDYLGEYAYFKKELNADMYHPNKQGHIKWTLNVLMPELIRQGYFEKVNTINWLANKK